MVSKFSEGPWYVYILLCENKTLYTGITKNTEKRFDMHIKGKGAKYTKINKPVSVVYTEEHPNHESAIKREIKIKRMTKKRKLKLFRVDEG